MKNSRDFRLVVIEGHTDSDPIPNVLKEYYPKDRENKLKNVGEVELAREAYIENTPKNLKYLLYKTTGSLKSSI